MVPFYPQISPLKPLIFPLKIGILKTPFRCFSPPPPFSSSPFPKSKSQPICCIAVDHLTCFASESHLKSS
ncbi:hypothetical protein ES332_D12G097200v1 [Gossypium tomentosum]|uniref:Uncharacterized protein n=1 Tax=Gossypium tomentosum TaxID=34277 RepID=A0A5D2I8F9_GOSTO|nr:hypothetical protein ES332_D12G097200v1 [Gossypium tomentosum]